MVGDENEHVRALMRAYPEVAVKILREEGFIVTPPPEPNLAMDDFDRPNLTEQQLFEYLHSGEGLPVTRRSVKYAVMNREIIPTRLGNGNYFSRRDGLEWVRSRRRGK